MRPWPLLALALAAACGGGDSTAAPRWIRLATGFEPTPLAERVAAWQGDLPADRRATVEPDPSGSGLWLVRSLDPASWEADGARGAWRTRWPEGGAFAYAGTRRVTLRGGAREPTKVPAPEEGAPPRANTFYVDGGWIHLTLPEGDAPAGRMQLGALLEQGLPVDGLHRVTIGRSTADGITVWTGTGEEVVVDLPPKSALRFATSFADEGSQEVVFRVLLDGEELFRQAQTTREETGDWHAVALPPGGRTAARLRLEAGGPPGLAVFVDPTVGPADVGRPGARPWGEGRPNLALFLIDTFRADNLAAYGGPPDLTPSLNAFAEDSVRFLQARAPAGWTLPSISSLLTGCFPPEHGAMDRDDAMSTELVTLAEYLGEHGYRTVGITDGAVVSRTYHMDQGFAWYQEAPRQSERSLGRTFGLADELLHRDDGRPVFFFVHTYRAHSPFRVGEDEDTGPWDALMKEVNAKIASGTDRGEAALERAADFEALYRRGAAGLDPVFGRWYAGLSAAGFFEPGFLAVASDHGEAFGEHGEMWHDGRLWEEKIRIPLLLHGPGLAPRDVERSASLVDLPATFAALAGLAPSPGWFGRSLLDLDRERPNLSFAFGERRPHEVTIVSGRRKVFAPFDPEGASRTGVLRAFDLEEDPAERHDVPASPWAGELYGSMEQALTAFQEAVAHPERSELTEDVKRALAELGYGGDDEEKR